MKCFVYKGLKKEGSYLYLDREDDFSHLPEQMLKLLGELEFVLSLELQPDTFLAQAEAPDVLAAIDENGFYLQLQKEHYEIP